MMFSARNWASFAWRVQPLLAYLIVDFMLFFWQIRQIRLSFTFICCHASDHPQFCGTPYLDDLYVSSPPVLQCARFLLYAYSSCRLASGNMPLWGLLTLRNTAELDIFRLHCKALLSRTGLSVLLLKGIPPFQFLHFF